MYGKLILNIPIGVKLKQYRVRQKLTQVEVVRRANLYGSSLTESAYSKLEQGNRNILLSDLIILKLILGFDYEDLFGENEMGEFWEKLNDAKKQKNPL